MNPINWLAVHEKLGIHEYDFLHELRINGIVSVNDYHFVETDYFFEMISFIDIDIEIINNN